LYMIRFHLLFISNNKRITITFLIIRQIVVYKGDCIFLLISLSEVIFKLTFIEKFNPVVVIINDEQFRWQALVWSWQNF
jgi:hypothetical protein